MQGADDMADAPAPEPRKDQDSGVATAPAKPKPKRKPTPRRDLPGWRVLLHNDDVNEVGFVVESIMMLTPLGEQQAIRIMLEAHNTGVALMLVTHRERAELYADQFQSRGLTVTIEPADPA
jgi:ATP-dependent Clp protease adaptor protein ClpS